MAATAPLSGFPAQKKPLDPNAPPVQPASVGLPPPPVPAAPSVPAVPLTSANKYGTASVTEPGGYSTLAPWQPIDPTQAPLGGSTGVMDLMQQRSDLVPPAKDGGAVDSTKTQGAAVNAPPPPPPTPKAFLTVAADPSAESAATVDWNAVSARAAGNAPAVKAPATTPPPETLDPNNHNVLDPNSPDYDPILAKQIADQNAGAKPPATATDHPTTDGTGSKPATSATPATSGQQPAAPSTNPADYKPTQTAAGQSSSDFDKIYQDWLTKQMGVSNPYDSEYVKQGLAVIDDQMNRQEAAGLRQLQEHFASRGLTGSSLEAQAIKDFQAQMLEQRRSAAFQLTTQQAQGFIQQEQTVGNLGTQFGQNLTEQQKTALQDIQNQISNKLQQYGIDKASADAQANRQVQQEIADANRSSTEKMHKQDLLAQYYQTPTGDEWDQYATQYGKDAATADLGPRPTASTTTTTTNGGSGPKTGGDNSYPEGTKPQGAATDNPAMNSDISNYQGISTSNPDTSAMRVQHYDAFVQKWGQDAATKYLGTRPSIAGPSPEQKGNWKSVFQSYGQQGEYDSMPLTTRQADWDKAEKIWGLNKTLDSLGPRPTA